MKIRTILLMGGLVLLGACSESKYDLDQLVPEEYHKILYVNNSGKQDLTLYDTDEDNKYTLSVVKSGSDPSLTASVKVSVLTQAELDEEYSEPEGTNYKLIGENCYSLDATTLDFSSADRYKLVNIFLKPQSVKAFMETDPEAVWVLPLQVTSETDSINAEKNELFLKWANYRFYMPFGSTNKKGKFIPAYIPPTVVIALIVVIIIAVLLKYRKFGRKLYAIGGNRQSALMMGLNVKKTMFQAYILDGFLAGLGGFLFCLNSCAGFVEQAKGLEMDAISSAVIGGTLLSGGVGTPIGTLFGVLIKGTISSLITTQGTLSSWWVRIILSVLLCFFIVIQSVIASMKKKSK